MPRYTLNTLFGTDVKHELEKLRVTDKPKVTFGSKILPTAGTPTHYKALAEFCRQYFWMMEIDRVWTILYPTTTIDLMEFKAALEARFPTMVVRLDKVWDTIFMTTPENTETYTFQGIPVHRFEAGGKKFYMTYIGEQAIVEKAIRESEVLTL